ncbi:MAG: hypothetical protein ACLFT3_04010 [Cyclobacteriaceae bacterium]
MNEELNKLRKSVNLLKAQVNFFREGAQRVENAVEDMSQNLDAFIKIYSTEKK